MSAFTKAVLPPQIYGPTWNGVFAAVGLNISDASTDATTAVGIGNLAGAAALAQYTSTKWNTAVSCCLLRLLLVLSV